MNYFMYYVLVHCKVNCDLLYVCTVFIETDLVYTQEVCRHQDKSTQVYPAIFTDLKQHIGLLQQLGHKQVYPAILINIKQH